MGQTEKWIQYAALLSDKIAEVFTEDSDIQIDKDELLEGDNLTDFIHALANAVPCSIYNRLTGDEKSTIGFNHLANKLIFQYAMKDKEG